MMKRLDLGVVAGALMMSAWVSHTAISGVGALPGVGQALSEGLC